MGIVNNLLDRLADRIGAQIQGSTQSQRQRDWFRKGESYSVESEISEALADLMLMGASVPVSGDSERSRWLDASMRAFLQDHAKAAVSGAFLTGDCIVVPSWNGRNMQNVVVQAPDFEVLECFGTMITACAYVVDRKQKDGQDYTLMQAVELIPYETQAGVTFANRYRMFASRGDAPCPLDEFEAWEGYEPEWYVPNVDRLLIGRFRSCTVNPDDPNSVKGAPICYGASAPIAEIRYLLDQMHAEFDLSEKAIMADKRLFAREWRGENPVTVLPSGRERLFVSTYSGRDEMPIHDWSPDIRYQAYLDALNKQEQLVERAVGVSAGVISTPNDANYMNTDNVRKSQQKTIGFIETARRQAEGAIEDMLYAWDALANFYDVNPMGPWDVSYDWSDEYVESYADRQNAILAGNAIGATDAADYRMWLFDESPEVASERVAEIQAAQGARSSVLMPVLNG